MGNFSCPGEVLHIVEGLAEAQKKANVAMEQPSMEPKLTAAKLILVKLLVRLQEEHALLAEATDPARKLKAKVFFNESKTNELLVSLAGIQNKKIQEWLVLEVAKALGEKMSMVAHVRELEDMLKMNGPNGTLGLLCQLRSTCRCLLK
ncbi:hypothetical protein R1flu_021842 [Riccia fluitans]|uniref:Uncharacterized protein n=1 Tax=Riccia fluitans TaxID=41844 RepID=A0ABD1ZQJ9_9MARC